MDRRSFLINGILATIGLTALPPTSALAKWPGTFEAREEDATAYETTEAEALDDILEYVQFLDARLPGHNFRELLLGRLLREKTGLSSSEFRHSD